MKASGMLGVSVRRAGNMFRWIVRDRIGGVLAQGKEVRQSQAAAVGKQRKEEILAAQPEFREQTSKGIKAQYSVWAARHSKQVT